MHQNRSLHVLCNISNNLLSMETFNETETSITLVTGPFCSTVGLGPYYTPHGLTSSVPDVPSSKATTSIPSRIPFSMY